MNGYQCSTRVLIMNCYPSNVQISPLGGKFKIWKFFKQHWFLSDSLIFVIKYYFIPTLEPKHSTKTSSLWQHKIFDTFLLILNTRWQKTISAVFFMMCSFSTTVKNVLWLTLVQSLEEKGLTWFSIEPDAYFRCEWCNLP